MIAVYKITSPNNRVYVGSTINVKARFQKYFTLKCEDQKRLYNSFLKYGVKSHVFEIITECTEEEMYRLEATYGHMYDVFGKKGLNCALPKNGEFYAAISEDTKLKMSLIKKGKRQSIEQRLNRSKSMIGNKNCLGAKNNKKLVLDCETGIYYETAKEAAICKNINAGSLVNMLNQNHRHKNRTTLIYA